MRPRDLKRQDDIAPESTDLRLEIASTEPEISSLMIKSRPCVFLGCHILPKAVWKLLQTAGVFRPLPSRDASGSPPLLSGHTHRVLEPGEHLQHRPSLLRRSQTLKIRIGGLRAPSFQLLLGSLCLTCEGQTSVVDVQSLRKRDRCRLFYAKRYNTSVEQYKCTTFVSPRRWTWRKSPHLEVRRSPATTHSRTGHMPCTMAWLAYPVYSC